MAEVYAVSPTEVASEISKLLRISIPLRSVSRTQADTAEYKAAVTAYDKALRETVKYMESVKSGRASLDLEKEFELSQLWSNASVAISIFDPDLANRCFIKGQGWLDPAVWGDPRYRRYRIGIDDMREAIMTFNQDHPVVDAQVPGWFPIAGVGFAVATFLSLFYLLVGPDLSQQKKIIFDAWFAFCVAASAAFLGGSAVASGTLRLPFIRDSPVKFSAFGGIAIFIVVLLVMISVNR